jgi:hypothetical protein
VAGKGALNSWNSDTRPFDPSFHHASHHDLLADVPAESASRADVDAVIVPTARPEHWLREAMKLARGLDSGLVAMCSQAVKAVDVVDLAEKYGVPVIAVDVTPRPYGLPRLLTNELLEETRLAPRGDLAKKRNLALLLSWMAGWKRVFFVDDDIYAVNPADVRAAVGLLDEFDVIGMHNGGYPDNSVVCHAYRELGAKQAQFIGGGTMAFTPPRIRSFFPNTYNDDWFFILGYGQPTRIAITGSMRQKEYRPFSNPDRARVEEFGDVMGEGLYWLLDHKLPMESADLEHWRDFLIRRWYFIDHLIAEASKEDWEHHQKARILASLNAARSMSAEIRPRLCAEYIRRWRIDLTTWRAFIEEQPAGLGVAEALAKLSWPGVVTSAQPWPVHDVDGDGDEDRLACESGSKASAAGAELAGAAGRIRNSSRHASTLAGNGAVG